MPYQIRRDSTDRRIKSDLKLAKGIKTGVDVSGASCSCSTILLVLAVLAFFYFTGRASADAGGCFHYAQAKILSRTNTYSRPVDTLGLHTSNSGALPAGTVVEVLASLKLKRLCWIQFDNGWLANSRVAVEPVDALPALTEQEAAERNIEAALEHLKESSDHWYGYVAEVVKEINVVPDLTLDDEPAAAVAHFPEQTVSIHPRHTRESSPSVLAATLVHEACHLRQGLSGYANNAGIFERETRRERQCYTINALALQKLDANEEDLIEKLRCLGREYNQYFSVDHIIQFVCGIGLWD